jgi:deoxycytidine triphosphate deaminase
MRYSDVDLIYAHDYGDITIEPFTSPNLSIASYDFTLGRYLLVPKRSLLNRLFPWLFPLPTIKFNCDKNGKLTVIQGLKMRVVDIYDRPFVLRPGQFLLGNTHEYVGQESKSLDLEVSDKSTLARCGLSICFSATLPHQSSCSIANISPKVVGVD